MTNPIHSRRLRLRAVAGLILGATLSACATTTTTTVDGGFAEISRGGVEDTIDVSADRPPTEKSLHAAARISRSQGRYAAAEVLFNRLLTEYPDYMPAYNDLAELYVRNGMLDSAVRTLEVGLTHSADDVVLLNNLGMCHLLKHQFDDALGWFTDAAGAQPVNARTRANLAAGLALMGRMEEAFSLYLQVMPAGDAHHNMAVLFESMGNAEMARIHRKLASS